MPEEAARLGRELSRTSVEDKDALYRLFYFAAQKGQGTVLMDYAACLDPVHPVWGTVRKNAPRAWNIYEKAKESGIAEATAAQRTLSRWLLEEARSGNGDATKWLRQIPQE